MSLPETLAFIDVETTGANPVADRVTEIAVIRVEGGRVVERWESLVNPGIPIPPTIQRVTGITDAMVADAPAFPALAESVQAILEGCVFVAHNARFDYGFIKNEFQRAGGDFEAPVLCTVKLSRALYPEHHRHGLDTLIERHGFTCAARHRAMGDTEVLWSFAQLISQGFPPDVVERAVDKAMKRPARPAGLPEGMVEGMPDSPGVYLFHGENQLPLYIGKSVSLRSRVMAHFAADHKSGKEADLARQVRRVEWIETAGELGALLTEAALVKSRQPIHNRLLRANEEVFALRLVPNRRRAPILERVPITGTDPREWEDLFGTFRTRKEADNLLRELALLYQLCTRRLGLEPGAAGACLAHQMKRCAGVCAGKERPEVHDARLAGALGSARLKPWAWPGRVVVAEHHSATDRRAWHLLDSWCHLGSADSPEGLQALVASAPPRRFELDTYRILARWFDHPNHCSAVTPWDE
ncbi:MAG: exonuclease domain-containing protein [Rhodocyclaceae bacterium]|nr:exonuclease domain-containing protein [Rhodocyclaceae bacterium]